MKKILMIATAALTVFASAESPYVHKSPRDRFGLMVNATQKEDWKTVVYQGYFLTERIPILLSFPNPTTT